MIDRAERLFRHTFAIARRAGLDPIAEIAAAAPTAPLADVTESRVLALGERLGARNYWADLVRYEAACFRAVEAHDAGAASRGGEGLPRVPRRCPCARIESFQVDVPALCFRLERIGPEDPLPVRVPPRPTRLLIAVSPGGALRAVRCSTALEAFFKAVDGIRDQDQIAGAAGIDRALVGAALRSLADVGAVVI